MSTDKMSPKDSYTTFLNRFHDDDRDDVREYLDDRLEEKWVSLVKNAYIIAELKGGVAVDDDGWLIEDYDDRSWEWKSFHQEWSRYYVCYDHTMEDHFYEIQEEAPELIDNDGYLRGERFLYHVSFRDGLNLEDYDRNPEFFVELLEQVGDEKELEIEDFEVRFTDGTHTHDEKNLATLLMQKMIELDGAEIIRELEREGLFSAENLIEKDSDLGLVVYGKMQEIEQLSGDLVQVGIEDLTDEYLETMDVTIREALRGDYVVKKDVVMVEAVLDRAEKAWVKKDRFLYWAGVLDTMFSLDSIRTNDEARKLIYKSRLDLRKGLLPEHGSAETLKQMAYQLA